MSPQACIIGAGSSGIVALKTLRQHGIEAVCYEKGSGIGGNWRYQNDNGMSSAYRSLHINTSRNLMAYSDFPMPADYPDYPHHSQVLAYFENYVDHFGLRPHIRFETGVAQVDPLPGGGYRVYTESGESEFFPYVLVANGHHWAARWPDPPFPGEFSGTVLHSHDYKEPDPYAGKRVVVLGIGNSAVDIACELARLGGETYLATRSGAHILPKYVLGRPTDTLSKPPLPFLPMWMQRSVLGLGLWLTRGAQTRYGVPKPKRRLLQEHPTISADLLNLAGHGRLQIKPNIKALQGDTIAFEDGSQVKAEVLIYATGYHIRFPFLDDSMLGTRENEVALYHHVVHPDQAGLYFIGLIQPLGAIMPLAEAQANWVAKLITGSVHLPDRGHMQACIDQARARMQARYIHRARHTIQVDFFPYLRLLRREIKRYQVQEEVSPEKRGN